MLQELTERQQAIQGLKAAGKTHKEIAAHLGIEPGTVKVHMRAIKAKEFFQEILIKDKRTRNFLARNSWELVGMAYEDTEKFLQAIAKVPMFKFKHFRNTLGPVHLAKLAKYLKDAGVIEEEKAWLTPRSEAYEIIKNPRAIRPLERMEILKGNTQDLERLLALNELGLRITGMGARTIREVAEALEEAGKIPSAVKWLKRKIHKMECFKLPKSIFIDKISYSLEWEESPWQHDVRLWTAEINIAVPQNLTYREQEKWTKDQTLKQQTKWAKEQNFKGAYHAYADTNGKLMLVVRMVNYNAAYIKKFPNGTVRVFLKPVERKEAE